MDQDVERRIRDRAYAIWEEEGCPEGRDAEHWMKACEEVAAEDGKDIRRQSGSEGDAASEGEKPKRARATRSTAKAAPAKDGDKPATKGRKSAKPV